MICSLSDLRDKEIIDIKTGKKLGYVDDIEFDTETEAVIAFILYGRLRFFGLLGRDDDLVIRCREIEVIGEDTILVKLEDAKIKTKKRILNFENLYK